MMSASCLNSARLLFTIIICVLFAPSWSVAESRLVPCTSDETDVVVSMLMLAVSHQRIPIDLPAGCPGYIRSLRFYRYPEFPDTLLNATSSDTLLPLQAVLVFVSTYYSLPAMSCTVSLGAAIAQRTVTDSTSVAVYTAAVMQVRSLQLLAELHRNYSHCFGLDPDLLTPVPFAKQWTYPPEILPEYSFRVVINGTSVTRDIPNWAVQFAKAAGAVTASSVVVDKVVDWSSNATSLVWVRFVGPDAPVLQANALQFSSALNAKMLGAMGVLEFRAVLIASAQPSPPSDGMNYAVVLLVPLLVAIPLAFWGGWLLYGHVMATRRKREQLDEELRQILLMPDDE